MEMPIPAKRGDRTLRLNHEVVLRVFGFSFCQFTEMVKFHALGVGLGTVVLDERRKNNTHQNTQSYGGCAVTTQTLQPEKKIPPCHGIHTRSL